MTVIQQPAGSLTNDRATPFLLVGLRSSAGRARRCVNAMSERNRNVERSVSFFLRWRRQAGTNAPPKISAVAKTIANVHRAEPTEQTAFSFPASSTLSPSPSKLGSRFIVRENLRRLGHWSATRRAKSREITRTMRTVVTFLHPTTRNPRLVSSDSSRFWGCRRVRRHKHGDS